MALIDLLYPKILIAIVESEAYYELYVSKKVRTEETTQKQRFGSFETLQSYIDELYRESPYSYTALLNSARFQGALPTCDKRKMRDFTDVSLTDTLCIDERWSVYSASDEIRQIQKRYDKRGVDFIFSPFVLLAKIFADKIGEKFSMFVLIENERISIAVFSDNRLQYAFYAITDADEMALLMQSEEDVSEGFSSDFDEEDDKEDEIDLDLDDFDSFGDIETIDEIEKLDDIEELEVFEDFDEGAEAALESAGEKERESANESSTEFTIDYYRFSMIRNALKEFYTDERFEQSFIESIYIADGANTSSDMKSFIEEELLISPILRRVDLAQKVMELTIEEMSDAS